MGNLGLTFLLAGVGTSESNLGRGLVLAVSLIAAEAVLRVKAPACVTY